MHAIRLILAFAAGAWLYQTVVVLNGFLAAIAIPKAYFDWFGRGKVELALMVLDLVVSVLPISVLVAGGTLCVWRVFAAGGRRILVALLAGFVACFVSWLVAGVIYLPPDLPVEPYPPAVLLRQILLPPWWAVPGFLAPWLGFALAVWLVVRRRPA